MSVKKQINQIEKNGFTIIKKLLKKKDCEFFKKKSIQVFRLLSDFALSENRPLLLTYIARILLNLLFCLPVSKHKLVHNL